jgi:hypothetical protein
MALPPDFKIQAIATHALATMEDHLMTWPELEAYASGAVALVACITPSLELSVQGVYSEDVEVREGEFLRVGFGDYWVFSPQQNGLSPIAYRCRMTGWLEQIQLQVPQRARLKECVQGLRSINDAAFTNFTSLLLSDTAAATTVRLDLVEMLPGSDQIAVRLEQTLQQFPKRERLPRWMAPFRFKRQ